MTTIRTVAVAAFAFAATGACAQEAFDACALFTQAEARKALGVAAEPEPVNAKARKAKVVPVCTWWGSRDGKSLSASATFRFARNEADARRAFDDERFKFQTKPLLIGGAPAFWSAKLGTLQFLKGRTRVLVSVGGAILAERDPEAAKKVAEALEKKF